MYQSLKGIFLIMFAIDVVLSIELMNAMIMMAIFRTDTGEEMVSPDLPGICAQDARIVNRGLNIEQR